MTCKDCIHHDVCFDIGVLFLHYATGKNKENVETNCPLKNFKNKADYAEVKHGEWLLIVNRADYLEPPTCDTAKCSVCGKKIDVSETGFKYCPHCGAKMDGRRTE